MTELTREVEAESIPIEGEVIRRRRSRGPATPALFEEPMPKMAAPSIMDRYREESPKLDPGSDMRAILAGATPLLAGFLGGNMGDGYEIASKGLLQEDARRQKQDESLLGILKTQAMIDAKGAGKGKGGSSTQRLVLSPDGSGRQAWANADEIAAGAISQERFEQLARAKDAYIMPAVQGDIAAARTEGQLGTQKRYGLLDKPVKGPMGEELLRDPTTGAVRPAVPENKDVPFKSPQHQAMVARQVEEFNSKTRAVQDALAQADELLAITNLGTPEGDSFLTFAFAKLAGSGQLSDEERKAITGGKSIDDWVDIQTEKIQKGTFPDHIRKRIVELAKKVRDTKQQRFDRMRADTINRSSKLVGLSPEQFEKFVAGRVSGEQKKKPIKDLSDEELDAEIKELKSRLKDAPKK